MAVEDSFNNNSLSINMPMCREKKQFENTRKISTSSECSKVSGNDAVISTQENEEIGGTDENSGIDGNSSQDEPGDEGKIEGAYCSSSNYSNTLCGCSLCYCLCCGHSHCLRKKEININDN